MREYLNIGCVPADESCAQVGTDDYECKSRKECATFIGQLRRIFGDEPDGARLGVKSFPHDFGSYMEVVCLYGTDKPVAVNYAFRCESCMPMVWDAAARQQLGL